MFRSRAPLAVLAALLMCSPAWAQRYNFKFYGEEEGLQNLGVQVVLQDRAGFLWAGTQNGLYRYDGNRFSGFTKNQGLPGTRIDSLHEAADGTLWVGTRSGLARRVGDRFETVPIGSPQAIAPGIMGRQGIATDANGDLYLATESGLVVGTPDQRAFKFTRVANPEGQREAETQSVYLDSSGTAWYGCGTGLCVLSKGVAREIGKEQGLPADRWFTILGDVDGNLWVRGDKGIFRRSAGTSRFEALPTLPETRNTIPTAALDPQGRLLVPTDQGLARERAGGWEYINVDDGLNTSDITAVMQDREGSIWLGLSGSGLARWLGYQEWESWTQREGLSRSSVWSIARDRESRLWVGTQSGLNYSVTVNGQLAWKHQVVAGVEWARAVATAADGSLWIAADSGGLVHFHPRTGVAKKYEVSDASGADAVHVMVDHAGWVWLSTKRGLFRSTGAVAAGGETSFEQMRPVGGHTDEGFVLTVEDASGQVWACGDVGLARYSAQGWRRFTKVDGLKDNMLAQVAADTDGSVWVGYREAFGVTHLSLPQGQPHVEHYTSVNGLKSDKSIFLGFDRQGRLWAGTDHGVDVFDRTRWHHYGRADGLIWDDTNSQAFLAAEDGIWIGTSRGISRYRPRTTPLPSAPPPVVFTAVRFGNQNWNPDVVREIPYDQRALQVSFAALTFVQESDVLFRYNLGGEEQETSLRELNYPTLPPGDFVLTVMAKNAQGVWSVAPARLEFRIATPWFLSWWFRVACLVLALASARIMWQRRTYRLEADRHRLERAVTERTRELSIEKARAEHETTVVQEQKVEIERLLVEAQQASKLKSEFLANMSHEIRTPMNGVLGMTDLVLATPLESEQREYLEAARHSADSLLIILNDILDFSKIEAGRLDLNPIEFSLRQNLEQIQKMFVLPLAAKDLGYTTDISSDVPDQLVGDPDRLRQVLLNLVGNAVKFTHQGSIALLVRPKQESAGHTTLHFEVRDTGIGIPADKCQVIFESFRQVDGSTTRKYGGTGLGLTICSRLVELMGGALWVESELEKGSTFQFTARFGLAGTAEAGSDLQNMARAVGAAEPAVSAEPTRRLRVLLAEDNVINQRLATKLLEKRGHAVSVTATGRQAVEMLAQGGFDVVLMDVQMPDMDGLQATALIREREAPLGLHVPVIALTAHTMKGDRERCLQAGMDSYITKPVNAAELISVVEATAAAFAPSISQALPSS
ncbi:MAG: ATP-binding protein [Acidobacteriota bacterium]